MIKDFSNLPDRDEQELLHKRELDNARDDAAELFSRSYISHEGDIPDEEERRNQAIAEMIAATILLTSEHYHLEMATPHAPDQQQKKGSKDNRELPNTPISFTEDIRLDDFRTFPTGR